MLAKSWIASNFSPYISLNSGVKACQALMGEVSLSLDSGLLAGEVCNVS